MSNIDQFNRKDKSNSSSFSPYKMLTLVRTIHPDRLRLVFIHKLVNKKTTHSYSVVTYFICFIH